jgi:hypothetical protein
MVIILKNHRRSLVVLLHVLFIAVILVSIILYFGHNFKLISTCERTQTMNNNSYTTHIRSFYTETDDLSKIEKHARKQFWTKGENTILLYFNSEANTPDITAMGLEFDPKYWQFCEAVFYRGFVRIPNKSLCKGPIIKLKQVKKKWIRTTPDELRFEM